MLAYALDEKLVFFVFSCVSASKSLAFCSIYSHKLLIYVFLIENILHYIITYLFVIFLASSPNSGHPRALYISILVLCFLFFFSLRFCTLIPIHKTKRLASFRFKSQFSIVPFIFIILLSLSILE